MEAPSGLVLRIMCLLLVVAGTGLAETCAAGELDDVRRSVRDDDDPLATAPAPPGRPSRPKCNSPYDALFDDTQDDADQYFTRHLFLGFVAPYWMPYRLLRDDLDDHGYVVPEPYVDAPAALKADTNGYTPMPTVFGRLQLDALTNLDDLERIGGNVLLEMPNRFGIDSTWSAWREDGDRWTDTLWLGDFNVVYRFAQSPRLQFRSGLGINWMADRSGSDFGGNYTYGVDWFPARPWVISTSLDVGWIGHAGLFHNQTTVGVTLRRWELFTGFDYYRIGSGELCGWINGIRFRF